MNKTLLSAALVAAFGFSAIGSAAAADGKITFNGTITSVTCPVKGGTGTDGGAQNFTVTLPTVATTALAADNAIAGETPFSVIVGDPASATQCLADGKAAYLRFEPASSRVNTATGRLINDGTATKVEVEVLNKAKQAINMYSGVNANGSSETVAAGAKSLTLNYWAQYHATGGASTAGSVTTFANYSVVYN